MPVHVLAVQPPPNGVLPRLFIPKDLVLGDCVCVCVCVCVWGCEVCRDVCARTRARAPAMAATMKPHTQRCSIFAPARACRQAHARMHAGRHMRAFVQTHARARQGHLPKLLMTVTAEATSKGLPTQGWDHAQHTPGEDSCKQARRGVRQSCATTGCQRRRPLRRCPPRAAALCLS